MLVFTTVEITTEYTTLAMIFFLIGMGMGLTMAPSTNMVMDSIPHDKAGVGSATNDASREVGGAFGIAIVGSALNEIYQREMVVPEGMENVEWLPADYSAIVSESFPAAMRIGQELLASGNALLGQELIENSRFAFMEGMTGAAIAAAGVALLNAILVKLYMPSGTGGTEELGS
jgi:MFS family permease